MDGQGPEEAAQTISVKHRAVIAQSLRLAVESRARIRDVAEQLARARELWSQSEAILLRVSATTAAASAWLGGGETHAVAVSETAAQVPAEALEAVPRARSDESGDRQFAAVHDLIRLVNVHLALRVDPVDQLAACIRDTIDGGADPYILLGLLLEGIGYAVEQRLANERRADAVAAVLAMLRNRLRHNLRR